MRQEEFGTVLRDNFQIWLIRRYIDNVVVDMIFQEAWACEKDAFDHCKGREDNLVG